MDMTNTPNDEDRAQAYTLEGVLGALLILTGLLFSMQAIVLTPTTGGDVDAASRGELEQTANDVLEASTRDGSLSRTVRYWNNSTAERTFAGGHRQRVGYGNATPPTRMGALLDHAFGRHGYHLNVVVYYPTGSDPPRWEEMVVVYQGVPSTAAVGATHPVTLYDDDQLTGLQTANETVGQAHQSGMYPVPDAEPNGVVYSVAIVRVVVW